MKKEKKTARPSHHRIFIKFFHRVHVAPSTRGEASLFLKVVFLLNENVGIGSIITLASVLSINKATKSVVDLLPPPAPTRQTLEATQTLEKKRCRGHPKP
jgi:hypothetical protein